MGDEVLELNRAAFVDDGEIRFTGDGSAAAQLAAKAGDFSTAMEAAQIADDAAQKPAGARSGVSMKWAVKRTSVAVMAADMQAQRYLVPDLKALNKDARAHKDLTSPPTIQGVEFELVADVAAKR